MYVSEIPEFAARPAFVSSGAGTAVTRENEQRSERRDRQRLPDWREGGMTMSITTAPSRPLGLDQGPVLGTVERVDADRVEVTMSDPSVAGRVSVSDLVALPAGRGFLIGIVDGLARVDGANHNGSGDPRRAERCRRDGRDACDARGNPASEGGRDRRVPRRRGELSRHRRTGVPDRRRAVPRLHVAARRRRATGGASGSRPLRRRQRFDRDRGRKPLVSAPPRDPRQLRRRQELDGRPSARARREAQARQPRRARHARRVCADGQAHGRH